MSITSSLQSLKLSSPFLHGSTSLSLLSKPNSSLSHQPLKTPTFLPPIRALKSLQGKVVCATNDKTVSVEVVRLAPHPKYKRRVRKKKKFQAHDPDNQFKVGDYVQLEKSRPISKTKTFIAVPVPSKNGRQEKKETGELGIPLESQQPQEQQA
ncbi:Ribosomal protein S17 [Theobroma cacao]|uniref:Small ribosomal subunit protein uS17c n=1 Tax=Theobroma cacao TaxID=3641 RepID=A0A061GAC0_THECC|nr:Ribosomal protein S17 [Theobroma cacao]